MTDEKLIEWRNAVIDELTSLHIYSAEHDADPRKAVLDIVEWNQRLALDPAVSAEARALHTQGWNEAIEAAAVAYQTEAETWLQLPARGACSRLGAQAIRALSVPAIVEAGEHQPKENTDASSD